MIERTIAVNKVNFMVHIHNNDYVSEHSHKCFEFLIILSGAVKHLTENKEETLISGDVMFFSPGVSHSFYTPKSSSIREIIISPSFFKECCDNVLPGYYETILTKKTIKTHRSIETISAIENNILSYNENQSMQIKNAFKSIIISNLIGFLLPDKKFDDNNSTFKESCMKAMNKYYAEPDAMNLIRNDMGYNEIYFCRKFKKCFNCTLVEYVNDLRLNYAAYLLESQKQSVAECINLIGLDSMPYFIKIFKKKYGITPSEYRKNHSNN